MDTETVSPNFDDIRPLNNSEVKDAIEKLVANEDFERALRYIKPRNSQLPCVLARRRRSLNLLWPMTL